jgi:hypothetical protein
MNGDIMKSIAILALSLGMTSLLQAYGVSPSQNLGQSQSQPQFQNQG